MGRRDGGDIMTLLPPGVASDTDDAVGGGGCDGGCDCDGDVDNSVVGGSCDRCDGSGDCGDVGDNMGSIWEKRA